MEQRNRNTAILLIVAGLYLLFGSLIGYFTVTAVLILWLAVVKIRAGENNFGYILFGVAVLLLLNDHFVAMVAIIFVLLGLYYFHTRQVTKQEQFLKRQNLLESLQWNKEQWELRDMSISSVIGEVRMDFSLAVMEQKETTVTIQGVVGDVDIIIPEDIGVSIVSSVLLGQTDIGHEKEAGLNNKLVWRSPHYEDSEYKVKLEISYVVGDVKIRRV